MSPKQTVKSWNKVFFVKFGESHMSNKAILAGLGHRLSRRRIELELTQAELAGEAGVSADWQDKIARTFRLESL